MARASRPRRGVWLPPAGSEGDRPGEPSEDDPVWRWEVPVGLALGVIVALSALVVLLIWILASTFPADRTYSDGTCTYVVRGR